MVLKKDDASVPRNMTHSLVKRNEVALYVPTYKDVRDVPSGEKSQMHKNAYCVIPCMFFKTPKAKAHAYVCIEMHRNRSARIMCHPDNRGYYGERTEM